MTNTAISDHSNGRDIRFVHPDIVQSDERFQLRVEGLPISVEVEISATMADEDGNEWRSSATYSTTDGTLALDQSSPVQGPFDRADTMGLLEWMQPIDDDVDVPYRLPEEAVLEFTASVNGTPLGSSSMTRTVADPRVKSAPVSDDLVGTLYLPPETDRAPGVILLHGSDGRPLDEHARLFASRGFASLALKFFNFIGQDEQDLPVELVNIPVDYVDRAVDWMLSHDAVEGPQVGVYGFSKGGELGLLAASHNTDIGAVVAKNSSALVWEGSMMGLEHPGPNWTIDGEPVEYIPWAEDIDWDTSQPFEFRSGYEKTYEAASDETIEAATISVEQIKGPVTLITGADDQMWNTARYNRHAIERLEEHDHQFHHLCFEEAGHTIMPPYRPVANRRVGYWLFGGTPEAYAEAAEPQWELTLETLAAIED